MYNINNSPYNNNKLMMGSKTVHSKKRTLLVDATRLDFNELEECKLNIILKFRSYEEKTKH